MPVDEQVVISLQNQIRSLLGRLVELEDWKSGHEGIQAGVSGFNYPHPYQKILIQDVGQFLRINDKAVQIRSDRTLALGYGIFFTKDLTQDPYLATDVSNGGWLAISGDYYSSTTAGRILIEAYGINGATIDGSAIYVSAYDNPTLSFLVQSGGSTTTFSVTSAGIRLLGGGMHLYLNRVAANPSGENGILLYRSDLNTYVGYDGAFKNFAFQDWVTANAIAAGVVLGAYKDADQEVTNTSLTADTELTVNLAASTKYQFSIDIFFLNDGAAEGYQVALSGTVGIQDLKAQASIYDDTLNTLVGFARITAIDTGVGAGLSVGSNFARVMGSIETTTAGTFLVKFAQNAAGAAAGVHHEIGCSMMAVKTE